MTYRHTVGTAEFCGAFISWEQERRADGDARLTLSHAHRSPPPATPCHPSTDARVTDYRWQS